MKTDARLKGLGAALIQNKKPIAYASKSLTDAKKRYACIERDLLAIVFGVQRFQMYIYMDVNLKYSLTISHLS